MRPHRSDHRNHASSRIPAIGCYMKFGIPHLARRATQLVSDGRDPESRLEIASKAAWLDSFHIVK